VADRLGVDPDALLELVGWQGVAFACQHLGSGDSGGADCCCADGDRVALEIFGRLGHWLGVGASVLLTLLDLRRIVVGGGVVAAGDLFLDEIRETVRQRTFARKRRELPSIEAARLGADAGWVGAGLLALHDAK
jgi:predicted NBD/HSP70 family sugar kinase